MEPMEQLLRDSGQFGPDVAVDPDASPQDRLIAFIGRDPAWQREGRSSRAGGRVLADEDGACAEPAVDVVSGVEERLRRPRPVIA
jgi:hypothetical protein